MENYRIELPDGTTVMEDFVSDRAAIAYAVDLNHGCSEKVSVFRITIPTRMCPKPNPGSRRRARSVR